MRSEQDGPPRGRRIPVAVGPLLAATAVTFAVVSAIHFGLVIEIGALRVDDPFPGAAIPEAVIAVVLVTGALAVLASWPRAWPMALGSSLFALLLTLFGLTVTIGSSRTGDVAYHLVVLAALLVIVALLLLPAGPRRSGQ